MPKSRSVTNDVWPMDELQRAFEEAVTTEGDLEKITPKHLVRVVLKSADKISKFLDKSLMDRAPDMLSRRRKDEANFAARNLRRWREAFDLIEVIWVSCDEIGRNFNQHFRPDAVEAQDYVFEAMTHLHAKSLLVVSEMICLMKGGFADGALTRWRTLHELNVVATLVRREGRELALRYLAHAHVQAWKEALVANEDDDDQDDEEFETIKVRAEYALAQFGDELKRTNGWACALTGQKYPTFEELEKLAGKTSERSLYKHASLHTHGNHRSPNDLLGMSESEEALLLVGPSNSGMAGPLTLASMSLVRLRCFLFSCDPISTVRLIPQR